MPYHLSNHQAVLNLFSWHKIIPSPSRIDLFLLLKILDDRSLPTCIYHTINPHSGIEFRYYPWTRCRNPVTQRHHIPHFHEQPPEETLIPTIAVLDAFQTFYHHASDPLIKDDDPNLHIFLVNLIRDTLLCRAHKTRSETMGCVVEVLKNDVWKWRRQYLITVPSLVAENNSERRTSRISRLLNFQSRNKDRSESPQSPPLTPLLPSPLGFNEAKRRKVNFVSTRAPMDFDQDGGTRGDPKPILKGVGRVSSKEDFRDPGLEERREAQRKKHLGETQDILIQNPIRDSMQSSFGGDCSPKN